MSRPLYEDLLPVFDVSDQVATVVEADPEASWRAMMDVDLIELGRRVPIVGALGAIRALPEVAAALLHGKRPPTAPESLRLSDLTGLGAQGGRWVLLAEREDEEIVLGLVGKFWRPVVETAEVSADEFGAFATPGFAKTLYSLAVAPLPGGRSLLTGTMRTATTDEHARVWFRRYWNLGVGSGAHVLVHALLEAAREEAEGPARSGRSNGRDRDREWAVQGSNLRP